MILYLKPRGPTASSLGCQGVLALERGWPRAGVTGPRPRISGALGSVGANDSPRGNGELRGARGSLGIVQLHATQFDGPLFRFLAERGTLDLTVYYMRENGDRLWRDPDLGVEKVWDSDVRGGYRFVARQPGVLGGAALLMRIARGGHDLLVVSGYSPASQLFAALVGRLSRQPVGLRSDTIVSSVERGSVRKMAKRALLSLIFRLYTTGHPTGSLAAAYLVACGLGEDALFRFSYSVDNEWLAERARAGLPQRAETRRAYGIPTEALTVLGVLKFVPREDPMTLLLAFARLRAAVPSGHLVLVGDGQLRPAVEEQIRRAGLGDCVHLPGYISYSQLPRHYVMADIFVHPAQREQWGVSVNEAMVCGVPVIAAASVGATRDLITDGESGLVFPAGDVEALAQRLGALAASEDLRARIAREAARRVRSWSYDGTAAELEAALRFVRQKRFGVVGAVAP